MAWYGCCYGHVVRWGQGSTEAEAAKYAYGVVDRVTVEKAPGNPRYMSQKKINEFQEKLFARHKQETGNTIT